MASTIAVLLKLFYIATKWALGTLGLFSSSKAMLTVIEKKGRYD